MIKTHCNLKSIYPYTFTIAKTKAKYIFQLIWARLAGLLRSPNSCRKHLFPKEIWDYVVYWPPTRPSCQNRKCTCVNNRCIRSRNIRIWPWLSRGWIECEIVTLAGRRVDVKLLYNPGDRKFKLVGVKML